MKYLSLILAFAFVGCGHYKLYNPNVLIDGQPALVEEGTIGGQGHISVKQEDGKREVEVVQFGMSDVLGGTVGKIFSVVGGVFGGNPDPPEITINMPGQDRANGQGNTDAGDVR